MISKKRHEALVNRVESLERELWEQRFRYMRLMDHFGLKELEIPSSSKQTKIVTKEEYDKIQEKEIESIQRLRELYAGQRNVAFSGKS